MEITLAYAAKLQAEEPSLPREVAVLAAMERVEEIDAAYRILDAAPPEIRTRKNTALPEPYGSAWRKIAEARRDGTDPFTMPR